MDPANWIELVRHVGNEVRFSAYTVFRKEFLETITSVEQSIPELDYCEIAQLLDREKIAAVPMDSARLDFYFRFLLDSGFIEATTDPAPV
jgi:hypothetical protein